MWMRTLAVTLFAALAASGRAVSADLGEAVSTDERLTLFARAVVKTGVARTLREPGPYIVFAPADRFLANEGSAFLLDSVLLTDANAGRLADLVRHHIVRTHGGVVAPSGKDELQTLAGVPLVVTRVGSGLLVDCCAVVIDRIAVDNGLIYVVDRLLWPRDRRWQPGVNWASGGALGREPAGDQQTLDRR